MSKKKIIAIITLATLALGVVAETTNPSIAEARVRSRRIGRSGRSGRSGRIGRSGGSTGRTGRSGRTGRTGSGTSGKSGRSGSTRSSGSTSKSNKSGRHIDRNDKKPSTWDKKKNTTDNSTSSGTKKSTKTKSILTDKTIKYDNSDSEIIFGGRNNYYNSYYRQSTVSNPWFWLYMTRSHNREDMDEYSEDYINGYQDGLTDYLETKEQDKRKLDGKSSDYKKGYEKGFADGPDAEKENSEKKGNN